MIILEIYKDNNLIVRTTANSCYELHRQEYINLCAVYRRKYPLKEIKLKILYVEEEILTYDPLRD